jgi:lipopolysaccharide transport system ATP-binding protein
MHAAIRIRDLGKRYQLDKSGRPSTLHEWAEKWMKAPLGSLFGGGAHTDTLWALRHVSLEVPHGCAIGIIGRNGAGKSTLLKILSRITRPSEGQVDICGRVGSLLEVGTGFHPELTGRENTFLNGALLGMRKAEILRKFDAIVDFADVERFLDTPVKYYSSGMYMRLAFAIAAHLEPEILIVDEVLAVGDLDFQKKCLGKMDDVTKSGRTVLFVSHNLQAISRLCSTAICLDHGQLTYAGPVGAAIEHYHQQSARDVDERAAEKRRRGSGEVRLRNVQTIRPSWKPDEPKMVEFQLHRIAPHVRKVSLSCRILNSAGTMLVQCDSRLMGVEFDLDKENGGRFALSTPWLPPGDYWVDLSVTLPGSGLLDHFERACQLRVVPILPYPAAAPQDALYFGEVLPDFSWEPSNVE